MHVLPSQFGTTDDPRTRAGLVGTAIGAAKESFLVESGIQRKTWQNHVHVQFLQNCTDNCSEWHGCM